jgi:Golgi phosphoprotein 3
MKVGYQLKQVRERIAKGLVDKGVLRTGKINFVLFDMATHPLADSQVKSALVRRIVDTLLGRGSPPDARTVSLIVAAYAANVLENALSKLTYDQKEAAFQRADEMLQEHIKFTERCREIGLTDVVAGVFNVYSKVRLDDLCCRLF